MLVKKTIITLSFVLIVPLFCRLAGLLFDDINYTNLFALIMYSALTVWCAFQLRGKRVERHDLLISAAIGLITLTYTIPLSYIGIVAGLCTACVFLSCRILLTEKCSFAWFRPGLKRNVLIFGGITAFFAIVFLTRHRGLFVFSPLIVLKAWAPAVSEELIFRVFFPTMVFKLLKLEDSTKNRIWVFIIITIPFAMLHCMDAVAANDIQQVVSRCYTPMVNAVIQAFLISRFGFIYGVYAHALSDFLAMSIV